MFSSIYYYLYLLLITILTLTGQLETRRVIYPKDLESFCSLYPLHRRCMGAFAGGGKRTWDETATTDDKLRLIITKYKDQLMRKLILLKELEQLYKLLQEDETTEDSDYDNNEYENNYNDLNEEEMITGNAKASKNDNTNDDDDDVRKSKIIKLLKKLEEKDSSSTN